MFYRCAINTKNICYTVLSVCVFYNSVAMTMSLLCYWPHTDDEGTPIVQRNTEVVDTTSGYQINVISIFTFNSVFASFVYIINSLSTVHCLS